MSEHTKGPWTTRHFNQIGHCKIGSPNWISADEEPLAILPIRRTWTNDKQYKECTAESIAECEANARLIAASPTLLQACQHIVTTAEALRRRFELAQREHPDEDFPGRATIPELQRDVAECTAAIAKATGK